MEYCPPQTVLIVTKVMRHQSQSRSTSSRLRVRKQMAAICCTCRTLLLMLNSCSTHKEVTFHQYTSYLSNAYYGHGSQPVLLKRKQNAKWGASFHLPGSVFVLCTGQGAEIKTVKTLKMLYIIYESSFLSERATGSNALSGSLFPTHTQFFICYTQLLWIP